MTRQVEHREQEHHEPPHDRADEPREPRGSDKVHADLEAVKGRKAETHDAVAKLEAVKAALEKFSDIRPYPGVDDGRSFGMGRDAVVTALRNLLEG